MSKNLKSYLEALKVENIDELVEALLSDEDKPEAVQTALKKSQDYARDFLEGEFNERTNAERKTWKGKYFKDAAQKVNKIFGSKLTNSELEKIMNDPENDGKTFDAVVDVIRAKVSDKTGTSEAELQAMLDKANGKISEYEQQMQEMEAKHKADFDEYVRTGKLTATLKNKLVSILQGQTSMSAEKAAELLKEPLMKKALIKLNDKDELELYDPSKPENRLKRNDTEFESLEGIVKQLATEYELPKAASGGAAPAGSTPPPAGGQPDKKFTAPGLNAAEGLAAAMAQLS